MEGFLSEDALLHAVETRTSSPLTIVRDLRCESVALRGLFPCGEGAGYAGGIVSAAVDGIRVAAAILGDSDAAEAGESGGEGTEASVTGREESRTPSKQDMMY